MDSRRFITSLTELNNNMSSVGKNIIDMAKDGMIEALRLALSQGNVDVNQRGGLVCMNSLYVKSLCD